MNSILILPILLVILMLSFVSWLVFKRGIINHNLFKNRSVVKILMLTYACVLVISVIIGLLIPEKKENAFVIEHRYNDEMTMVEEAMMNGQLDDVEPVASWEFPYHANDLHIQADDDEQWITVERKSENDGVIEAKYITQTMMDGIDITERIPSIEVELEKDTLTLMGNGEVTLNFAQFQKEFVISQFTGKKSGDMDFSSSDTRILYLKIPKDLNLVYEEDIYIDYIGEE